jgi:hypothetical protein
LQQFSGALAFPLPRRDQFRQRGVQTAQNRSRMSSRLGSASLSRAWPAQHIDQPQARARPNQVFQIPPHFKQPFNHWHIQADRGWGGAGGLQLEGRFDLAPTEIAALMRSRARVSRPRNASGKRRWFPDSDD